MNGTLTAGHGGMGSRLSQAGVDVNKTRDAFSELQKLNAKYGELALDATLAAGGALPPPFGTAVDIFSLGRSLIKGDWGGALIDLGGFVPLLGDGAKAGKVIKKLDDLRRVLDVAGTAIAKNLDATKKVAAKYWDDLIRANKKKFDDAIKQCTTKECREAAAKLKGSQYNNTPTSGSNGQWSGERGDSTWKPSNGGPEVRYNNGFPDYGPHSKGNVDIAMKGNRTSDFTDADKAMRQQLGDPNWQRPSDMTWHHNENGVTMQLIPKNIHATGGGASTPHMGGASLYTGSNATEF
jgi:hypothetical protein